MEFPTDPITPVRKDQTASSKKRSRTATEFNQSNPNIVVVRVKIGFEDEKQVNSLEKPYPNGDSTNPIPIDDEDEEEVKFIAEKTVIREKKGTDKRNPIWVHDDYYLEELMSYYSTAYLEDPKGKKPMKECVVVPVMKEVGECSNPPPKEPEDCCNICMEPKFRYECFDIKNCSHYYCASCVARYVEMKIEMNVSSIGCPDPGCEDGVLEPVMCQSIIKPEVFDRWGRALCEEMIGARKFYCPFKECLALLIDEEGGDDAQPVTQSECPHCCRLFCAQCKVPWHSGVTCREYQSLGVDERASEDMMLREMAKNQRWGRCPYCKFYVEKISGCDSVLCRCGNSFNYNPLGHNYRSNLHLGFQNNGYNNNNMNGYSGPNSAWRSQFYSGYQDNLRNNGYDNMDRSSNPNSTLQNQFYSGYQDNLSNNRYYTNNNMNVFSNPNSISRIQIYSRYQDNIPNNGYNNNNNMNGLSHPNSASQFQISSGYPDNLPQSRFGMRRML